MPTISSEEYQRALRNGDDLADLVRKAEAKEQAARSADDTPPETDDQPEPDTTPTSPPAPREQPVEACYVRRVLKKTFDVNPVGKPRQTRSDKWKKRPCVMRYRAYADAIRAQAKGWSVPEYNFRLIFYVEAPKTKQERAGDPHHLKPDIDNLVKAFFDALEDEDKYIWDCHATAYWTTAGNGKIEVWITHETDTL